MALSPDSPLGREVWTGRVNDLAPAPRVPGVDRHRRSGAPEAFDLLLAEAEEEGDLAALEEALAEHPAAARRAEGRLRAIQLAARAADARAVARHWGAAREELSPSDARRDTAYLLLDALAAAPLLSHATRAEAQLELAALWLTGELALPTGGDGWIDGRAALDPRLEVLARALEDLAPEGVSEARRAVDREGRVLRALAETVGGIEAPAPDGRWHRIEGTDLLARAERGGELALTACDDGELVPVVERAAELASGFTLAETGEPVGSPLRIAGRELRLHHPDPQSLVADEIGRLRLLRLGFAVLALLSAALALFAHRALVRGRRLAELKSRFVAGVSHDLRTPLASILLMAENLEEGRVGDAQGRARYHSSIRREATRLRRLVEDVLDFSRIERGERAKLAIEEVDLGRWLDELEGELADRVREAGAQLSLARRDLPRSAPIDADALRRALSNLVDNALCHSGSSELELCVRAEEGDLLLEVADRGRGIPAARREALFQPFVQGSRPTERGGGSGLGLAIVREIARGHGGEASIEDNHDGVGARVRLRLPLEDAR